MKKEYISKLLKILFLWIPVVLVSLIAIILITAKLYLSPQRTENLVKSMYSDFLYGSINLNIQECDLFTGFEIENIEIRSGKDFNNKKVLDVKKIVLHYNIFQILIGKVYLNEVIINKPNIFLEEKNNTWNISALIKPSDTEEPAEDEETDESNEISLPISIELLLKFALNDLNFSVKSRDFNTSLTGFSMSTDLYLPSFDVLPLSLDAVSLLEKLDITLNKDEKINVTYDSAELTTSPSLVFYCKLLYNRRDAQRFKSKFKFGTYKGPVRFKRSYLMPLNFLISYDFFYNPDDDILKLNFFEIQFKDKKWLSFTGDVKEVTGEQKFNLKTKESNVSLDDLFPYYKSLSKNIRRRRFSGRMSLHPLTINGSIDKLNIIGSLHLRDVYYKDVTRDVKFPSMDFLYSIRKISNNISLNSDIKIPHIFYTLRGSRSGDNGIQLQNNVSIDLDKKLVNVNKTVLRLFNPKQMKNAVKFILTGDINYGAGQSGAINLSTYFKKQPLVKMLPGRYREKFIKIPLSKTVTIKTDMKFKLNKKLRTTQVKMLVKVPDYDLKDLTLNTSIAQDLKNNIIKLKKFNIGSKLWNLIINCSGMIQIAGPTFVDSDMQLSMKYNNSGIKPIYGPWNIAGLLELNARLKGGMDDGLAFGKLKVENFFIKNEENKLSIEDINLFYPYEFNFKSKYKGESLLSVTKDQLIDNDNFKEETNFTIKSIKAIHPARKIELEYLKDFKSTMFFKNNVFQIADVRGYFLGGSVYGRNIFVNLANFDLKNMNLKKISDKIEYKFILDATNVDAGLLDDPDIKKRAGNAEISFNANFSGKGIDINRELTAKGYINIYKIGRKFANRLMKGLSTEKGKSKLGKMGQSVMDNFMKIESFNFNLDKGLIYTTVNLKRGFVGYIVGIKGNKVEFDRIPIQEYLRKVAKEE